LGAGPEPTLLGSWGIIEKGWRPVTETFHWVASRFTGGSAEAENVVLRSSAASILVKALTPALATDNPAVTGSSNFWLSVGMG
jgi:hypothetical protein